MTEIAVSPAPVTGPCLTWDAIQCVSWPAGSEAVSGYAMQSATEVLWNLSAQQFGFCDRSIRPCRRDCFGGTGWGNWWEWDRGVWSMWPQPVLYQGQWFNLACNRCPGSCSCTGLEVARLPGPVYQILQVKLDGEVMPTGSYRMDNDVELTRIDGGMWPMCQDMAAADDQPDTWSVTARFGRPVPVSGQMAVGELAREIALACLGLECRLPVNVTSLASQGVTITLKDPGDVADRLYLCGLFVNSYNPRRYRTTARAFDVDGPEYRRTNTSAQ